MGPTPFTIELEMLDGNPFVRPPDAHLDRLFETAGRDKGPIPIRGTVNGRPYRQTLVRFRGDWRLYVNMQMLDDSPRRIGESIEVSIEFDPDPRLVETPAGFTAALDADPEAKQVFDRLAPSRQKEIIRYLAMLKNEDSLQRNVVRAIDFLKGRGRFVGRDHP